jgi:hypothetical protein
VNGGSAKVLSDEGFERLAGACAIAVGVGGFAYSIAFVALLNDGGDAAKAATGLFLLLSGLVGTPVLVAVYWRLQSAAPGLALWGLLIGVVGAIGSSIHGGFDFALQVKSEATGFSVPNPVDPRGLLTFGIAGIGVGVVAWLIIRSGRFPRRLGQVGAVLAVLLVLIYLGRLIIFDPKNPLLLGAAALTGFVVNPVWWIWLGRELRARRSPSTG